MTSSAAPTPRHVPLAITGDPALVSRAQQVAEEIAPGAFDLRVYDTASAGPSVVESGEAFGLLTASHVIAMDYAGAHGPTSAASLTQFTTQLAQRMGKPSTVRDVRPLGPNDTAGLPLFYLVFGIVLASFLFSIASFTMGARLPRRGHWTAAVILAILLGGIGTALASWVTHTLQSGDITIFLLAALASLAVSSATYLCLVVSRVAGSTLAAVLLVVLGSAAGGLIPGPYLPLWLEPLRWSLPMGAAFTGIQDQVYFGGAHIWQAIATLGAWAVLAVALGEVLNRCRSDSGAPAD